MHRLAGLTTSTFHAQVRKPMVTRMEFADRSIMRLVVIHELKTFPGPAMSFERHPHLGEDLLRHFRFLLLHVKGGGVI